MKDHHHRQHFLQQLLCCCFYFSFLYFPFGGLSIQKPPTIGDECMDFGARELKGVSFILSCFISRILFFFFFTFGVGGLFFGRFLCLVRFLFWFHLGEL